MNKKMLFAWLAGFAVLFIAGFVVYEILLKSFYADLMAKMGDCALTEPPVLPIIIAQLCFSFVLVLWLSKNNVTTFMGGVVSSILMVLLVMIWFESWMFTLIPFITFGVAIVDVVVNTVVTLISAGVVGVVLGKVKY